MAFEQPFDKVGDYPADIDMSAEDTYQFTGVTIGAATGAFNTEGSAVKVPAAGAHIVGIMQNNPIAGEPATITALGISKARAGAAIASGDILMVNGVGRLVPATAGNFGVAKALAAAASGDLFTALVMPYGIQ